MQIGFHASVKDEIGEEEDERERRLDEGIWIDLKRHNKKLATVNQELLALFELTRELMKGGSKGVKNVEQTSSGSSGSVGSGSGSGSGLTEPKSSSSSSGIL